ncbi:MAG: sigma-70 family RNA polymerase sigma factor [Pseudomonadota bacterium]
MLGTSKSQRTEFEREALPSLPALYSTALRLVRNERDAEDLVQEVMLRAYRCWHQYQPGTNCKAWLFRILSNIFIDYCHRNKREHALFAASADDLESGGCGSSESQESSLKDDPEQLLDNRALAASIQEAMNGIRPDYRLVVLLCDVEELSYQEIAEILGCPVGTVMSRLHRARRLLQRALYEKAVEQGIVAPDRHDLSGGNKGKGSIVDLTTHRREKVGSRP